MADYNMNGYLGKNRNKTAANQPTHRGKCTIDNIEYWISAWTKDGRDGKFLSLAFQKVEDKPTDADVQDGKEAENKAQEDWDDDIPF